MGNETKPKGLSDTVLLILLSVVISLILINNFIYVDTEDINESEYYCRDHGGVDKYYFHISANKFRCSNGRIFFIKK